MARHEVLQVFASIDAIKKEFKVLLPKPYDWRLLQPCFVGEVNGLPSMRGTAIATNGILLAILQDNALLIGHMDSFVIDLEQGEALGKVAKVASTKTTKKNVPIEDFV
jgi:hypothetical protein